MENTHHHPADVATAIEFVNTRDVEADELPTAESAILWLRDHDLLHEDAAFTELGSAGHHPARAAERWQQIAAIRAAMRELADANAESRAPAAPAVTLLNETLARVGPVQVAADDGGIGLSHSHGDDPIVDALGRLVAPLAHEIADGRADRMRICGNDTCRWVFFDTSRPNTRRWCEMASCGNRAKAARHRARARETSRAPDHEADGPTRSS